MELMKEILSEENLQMAIKAVKSNKGAPGIDKMTVENGKSQEQFIKTWLY